MRHNPVPKDLAEAVIHAFADIHGVAAVQILGERRKAHLVKARLDIIEHLVFDLGYSGHSVAKALRRDHTTIGHHLRNIAPRKLSPTTNKSLSYLVESPENDANKYGCYPLETAE